MIYFYSSVILPHINVFQNQGNSCGSFLFFRRGWGQGQFACIVWRRGGSLRKDEGDGRNSRLTVSLRQFAGLQTKRAWSSDGKKKAFCVSEKRGQTVWDWGRKLPGGFIPQAAVRGRQTLLQQTQTCREVGASRQQASRSAWFTAYTVHACAVKMSKCLSHTQRNVKIWVMLRRKFKKWFQVCQNAHGKLQ